MFRLVSKFANVLRKVDNTIYIEIFAPFSFSPLLALTVGKFKMSEFEHLILSLTFLCLGILKGGGGGHFASVEGLKKNTGQKSYFIQLSCM